MNNHADMTCLASRFKKGDHEAVHDLVRLFGKRLHAFFRTLVRNDELAQDLVQDVFIRAYEKRAQLADPAKLESWLFTMARNLAYREMRRKRHSAEFSAEPEEIARIAGTDKGEGGVGSIHRHQVDTQLRDVLMVLDEKKRSLVALRYFSNLSLKEIAEIHDMPIGSVGTTIGRALAVIRKELEARGLEAKDLLP